MDVGGRRMRVMSMESDTSSSKNPKKTSVWFSFPIQTETQFLKEMHTGLKLTQSQLLKVQGFQYFMPDRFK